MPALAPQSFGVKLLSMFPSNAQKGLETHQGLVALYDAQTGLMKALINAGPVTAIRTAAVSGVAANILVRRGFFYRYFWMDCVCSYESSIIAIDG